MSILTRPSRPSNGFAAILAASLVAAMSAASAVQAQVVARSGLTLEGAKLAITAGIAHAKNEGAPGGVIAVVDEGGNLMAVERLDGTFAAGANISIGKARTAALFRKPTRFFEDVVNKGRVAMTALPDFTPLQGGVPIFVGGALVGAVGVSGAASAQQDEEIALSAAAAVATPADHTAPSGGAPVAPAAPATAGGDTAVRAGEQAVLFYDKARVDAAFAAGDVLFDGAGDRNYMVHASRREKAGLAEVHTLDTDILHVIGGAATFVTGGEVVEGRTVDPNEIRGDSIRGGQSRRIAAGDVVIVPHGTPHWFREVHGVLTYFVVKVR